MIVDKILRYLSQDGIEINEELKKEVSEIAVRSFTRQFMEEEREHSGMYLSAIGKCARQNAYRYLKFEKKGKAIDTRASINFFIGDVTELTIVCLAKLAGCNIENYGINQKKITLNHEGVDINGYPDGDFEDWNVEIKSMPSYRYEKFEKGEIDEDYLSQANVYAYIKKKKGTIFIALNKNNGVFTEKLIPYCLATLKNDLDNLTKTLKATPTSLPEPKYKPNEKGFYDWHCCYCSYWGHCHPNAELVLVRDSYKLKEK